MSSRRVNPMPPLPAGYQVLAEAFGDRVYARVGPDGSVECPVCGAGAPADPRADDTFVMHCSSCHTWLVVADYQPEEGWAGFAPVELLSLASTAYFLPRAWNPSGPWIARVDFAARYDNYCKERDSTCLELRLKTFRSAASVTQGPTSR